MVVVYFICGREFVSIRIFAMVFDGDHFEKIGFEN